MLGSLNCQTNLIPPLGLDELHNILENLFTITLQRLTPFQHTRLLQVLLSCFHQFGPLCLVFISCCTLIIIVPLQFQGQKTSSTTTLRNHPSVWGPDEVAQVMIVLMRHVVTPFLLHLIIPFGLTFLHLQQLKHPSFSSELSDP